MYSSLCLSLSTLLYYTLSILSPFDIYLFLTKFDDGMFYRLLCLYKWQFKSFDVYVYLSLFFVFLFVALVNLCAIRVRIEDDCTD